MPPADFMHPSAACQKKLPRMLIEGAPSCTIAYHSNNVVGAIAFVLWMYMTAAPHSN
jgi:hypothetical protein